MPVNYHTVEVKLMAFVHDTGDAFNLKFFILICCMVKSQYIGHTAATTTLHADTQALGCIKSFFCHQPVDFCDGSCCQCYRYGCCFHVIQVFELFSDMQNYKDSRFSPVRGVSILEKTSPQSIIS